MRLGHRRGVLALSLAVFVAASAALAQTSLQGELFRPVRTPRKGPAPPAIGFHVVARIVLDSALENPHLFVDDRGRVIAGLDRGWVAIDPIDGGVATDVEDPAALVERLFGDGWVVGGCKRKLRFRFDDDGVLHAEKRSRSASAWSAKWKLRFPGTDSGPPLTVGGRLYVGMSDNRVYAVKARNGHRLWARDLEARAVRPMAAWAGSLPARTDPGADMVDVDLVLIVRGDGVSAEALDPHDGKTVGTFSPGGRNDRLQGGPVVLPDGRVAVIRRGWRPGDVELLVLEVRTKEPEPRPDVDDEDPEPERQRTTTST